jgi:hypothetical protein
MDKELATIESSDAEDFGKRCKAVVIIQSSIALMCC